MAVAFEVRPGQELALFLLRGVLCRYLLEGDRVTTDQAPRGARPSKRFGYLTSREFFVKSTARHGIAFRVFDRLAKPGAEVKTAMRLARASFGASFGASVLRQCQSSRGYDLAQDDGRTHPTIGANACID